MSHNDTVQNYAAMARAFRLGAEAQGYTVETEEVRDGWTATLTHRGLVLKGGPRATEAEAIEAALDRECDA